MKLGLAVTILVAAGWTGVPLSLRSQAPSDPCSVLTDAEVGATIGSTVRAHRGDGDLRKPDMAHCNWTTSSPKQQALLEMGRVTAGARVQNESWVRQARQLGWTVEAADSTAALWCGRVAESAKVVAQILPGSGGRCEAVAKGFYITLNVSGPKATAPQVKALVEKITSRLP